MSTFSSVTQRPSGVKEWQQPAWCAAPSCPFFPERCTPEEVQATSYFAASASTSSFSITFTARPPSLRTLLNKHTCSPEWMYAIITEYMFGCQLTANLSPRGRTLC